MHIRYRQQNFLIENYLDLLKHLKTLHETDVLVFLSELLARPNSLTILVPDNYAAKALLKNLPKNAAEMLLGHLLTDSNELLRILPDTAALLSLTSDLTDDFQYALIQAVMHQSLVYNVIVKNKYALMDLITKLPIGYTALILEPVLNLKEEQERIIDSFESFMELINCLHSTYAQALQEQVIANPLLFMKFFSSSHALFTAINQFPEHLARAIIKQYDELHAEGVLALALKYKPQLIVKIIFLGAKPIIAGDNNSLHYLLNQPTFTPKLALEFMMAGCSPNTSSNNGETVLHRIAASSSADAADYTSSFLQLGTNPNLINHQLRTAMDIWLTKTKLNTGDYESILALIQHGADATTTNKQGKNILTLLFASQANMKNYLLNSGIKLHRLTDPKHVFKQINLAEFRLALKHQDEALKARSQFIQLLLMLFFLQRKANNPPHLAKIITTPAILLKIISQLDLTTLHKTTHECLALAEFILADSTARKLLDSMRGTPGGRNILQKNLSENRYQWTLFQSARTVACDYQQLKTRLVKEQKHKYKLLDKIRRLELTATSEKTLARFKEEYAQPYLQTHLSILTDPRLKLALVENVSETAAYRSKLANHKPAKR